MRQAFFCPHLAPAQSDRSIVVHATVHAPGCPGRPAATPASAPNHLSDRSLSLPGTAPRRTHDQAGAL